MASRGLAFRGSEDRLGSKHNGNYLGLLELLAEYDPCLKSHIDKYGNKGRGSISYLGKNICNEFVEILARSVMEEIVKQVKESKYFSISVDSTPDVTHTDQLTLIIRYYLLGKPQERFVKFIDNVGHKSENMHKSIINTFIELNLNLKDYRGQSYDNASNMSGAYNGLQAKIKEKTKMLFMYHVLHTL